jgi:tRNA modification GTPase
MISGDTIYALASGVGISAVAVVRISGELAIPVIQAMADRIVPERQLVRAHLRAVSGDLLDHGMVVVFPNGKSFTGEDAGELHLHGGRAVVLAVLEDLSARGLRAAEAGEFSRRAFLNGKIDLVEVEGLADLLEARTEGQRRQALGQMGGELSRRYESWRKTLVGILAHVEALVDFSDEAHVSEAVPAELLDSAAELRAEIVAALEGHRRGERMREGYRVVLAGSPNAGKSSLFNALLQRDAAIVSDVAGTTRDVLEVWLDLAGLPVLLMDTAGLRLRADNMIEAEGMARSRGRASDADLVIWVGAPDVDSTPEQFGSTSLLVWNKADLAISPAGWLPVSAAKGWGIRELLAAIEKRVVDLAEGYEPVFITRERHRDALASTVTFLENAAAIAETRHLELIAEELRQAAVQLGRLTGRVDVEDLLDVIFRDFCVGK